MTSPHKDPTKQGELKAMPCPHVVWIADVHGTPYACQKCGVIWNKDQVLQAYNTITGELLNTRPLPKPEPEVPKEQGESPAPTATEAALSFEQWKDANGNQYLDSYEEGIAREAYEAHDAEMDRLKAYLTAAQAEGQRLREALKNVRNAVGLPTVEQARMACRVESIIDHALNP